MAAAFKPCAIVDCNKNAATKAKGGRGWCSSHYNRFLRHGDPLKGGPSYGHAQRWLVEHASFAENDCLPWPFAIDGRSARGVVWFRGRQTSAARAMCILAHGEPPTTAHEAAHNCGKGHEGCVNPTHLRWATSAENKADTFIHGTAGVGARNSFAKLTEADVRAIRAASGTKSHAAIAADFGIDRAHASLIIRRGTWRHVI